MRPYIIAADIGTTSTKTLMIDKTDGSVMGSHAVEYRLYTPNPETAEQDPEEIFAALVQAIGELMRTTGVSADRILCVCFSSAMHSFIAVDKRLQPLTRCWTWADQRSQEYVGRLRQDGTGLSIYRDTGTPIHPMSPLLKLMWLRDHQPEIFRDAFKFIGIKEYVFAKLFDAFVVDHSIASATGLFNLEKRDWDAGALKAAGIAGDRLSLPVPGTHRLQGLPSRYASAMGLDPQTPFVVGASDGVLANLGAGVIGPGVFSISIGTSGAVRAVTRKPKTDRQGRLFCYALAEDYWFVGGAINNGGIVLRWVKEQLAAAEAEHAREQGLDPYDALTEMAAKVSPGADGLLFLPLLAGERAPYWNADARGVYFGLSLFHEKKHMIRAALEGVMFQIHSVVSALEELDGKAREIRASGGFARSALWCQMMADVLGQTVTIPDVIESSALGAAQLSLFAMGESAGLEARQWERKSCGGIRYEPDRASHETYRRLAALYDRIYLQLVREFAEISDFQKMEGKR